MQLFSRLGFASSAPRRLRPHRQPSETTDPSAINAESPPGNARTHSSHRHTATDAQTSTHTRADTPGCPEVLRPALAHRSARGAAGCGSHPHTSQHRRADTSRLSGDTTPYSPATPGNWRPGATPGNGHASAHVHTRPYTNPNSYPRAQGNTGDNPFADGHAHTRTNPHTDTHAYTPANGHTDPYPSANPQRY